MPEGQEPKGNTTTGGQEPTAGQEPKAGSGTPEPRAGGGSNASQEPTNTGGSTETFDAEYVKGLREEAAKHRTDKAAAETKLKEREDAELGEAEKAKKDAKEATERAEKAEKALLRAEVAEKKKLPASMAARLVGETRDELEKDAEKLLKDIAPSGGSGNGRGGGFDNGARSSSAKADPMDDFIRGGIKRQ